MIGLLTTRRWIGSLVLATVFAVVAVLLGNWQYAKHQDKVERRDRIETNYGAQAVSLTNVLTGGQDTLARQQEWTRVQVTGRYREEDELLVRNRPYRSVFGYEVLVPFELERPGDATRGSSVSLLVDRGWVPNAETAASEPEVPPPPAGQVRLTGWLRPSEENLGRDLPAGQVASINVADASEATGEPLYQAYLLLADEAGPGVTGARPAAADPPDTGLGVHFAYALQWWLTAPVGLVLVLLLARREIRESRAADPNTPAISPSPKKKTRKVRIWDEEDY